jgi:hypothetical protein
MLAKFNGGRSPGLASSIDYFVPEGHPMPVVKALAYYSGSFQVGMEGDSPLVKIEAEYLRWWVHSSLLEFLGLEFNTNCMSR